MLIHISPHLFFVIFSEEKKLSKYVSHRIQGNNVTLTVVFPEEGQYGMDIYTREVANTNGNGNAVDHDSEKHLLTHCCKYLINFSTQARRQMRKTIFFSPKKKPEKMYFFRMHYILTVPFYSSMCLYSMIPPTTMYSILHMYSYVTQLRMIHTTLCTYREPVQRINLLFRILCIF